MTKRRRIRYRLKEGLQEIYEADHDENGKIIEGSSWQLVETVAIPKSPAELIESREDLIAVIRLLANDFRENGNDWQNVTLDSYLLGLSSWTESMDRSFQNRGQQVPTDPTWKLFGLMLEVAGMYE